MPPASLGLLLLLLLNQGCLMLSLVQPLPCLLDMLCCLQQQRQVLWCETLKEHSHHCDAPRSLLL